MIKTDLLQPWAITEPALDALLRKAEAGGLSPPSLESKKEPWSYSMYQDGIALIPIRGGISKFPEPYGFLFGFGSSYDEISGVMASVLADPRIKAIVLDIDSPGGVVSGCQELAHIISMSSKPVHSWVNGCCTSAAYWLASATRSIGAPVTAQIGSIGVMAVHTDISKAEDRAGIKRTYLSAGAYKTLGNPSEPLSDPARAEIEGRLKDIYGIFTESIAKFRNLSPENAGQWADGKVFMSQAAQDVGLIDGIYHTIGDFIFSIKEEYRMMTEKELRAEYPDFVAQLKKEGSDEIRMGIPGQIADAKAEAIRGLMEMIGVVCGQEVKARIEGLHKTGITAEQMAAVFAAGIAAPQPQGNTSRADILAGLQAAGNAPLGATPPKTQTIDFIGLVNDAMKANPGLKRSEAMFSVRGAHPEAYAEWLAAQQKGGVR